MDLCLSLWLVFNLTLESISETFLAFSRFQFQDVCYDFLSRQFSSFDGILVRTEKVVFTSKIFVDFSQ